MAIIHKICSRCGGQATFEFGQRLLGGELRWSGREKCSVCGFLAEHDGYEDIPKELVPHLIAEEGEWRLKVLDNKKSVKALKVLRELLKVPLTEAKHLLEDCRGTHATVLWLQNKLSGAKIESAIEELKT